VDAWLENVGKDIPVDDPAAAAAAEAERLYLTACVPGIKKVLRLLKLTQEAAVAAVVEAGLFPSDQEVNLNGLRTT
jgi:hypothetical protein